MSTSLINKIQLSTTVPFGATYIEEQFNQTCPDITFNVPNANILDPLNIELQQVTTVGQIPAAEPDPIFLVPGLGGGGGGGGGESGCPPDPETGLPQVKDENGDCQPIDGCDKTVHYDTVFANLVSLPCTEEGTALLTATSLNIGLPAADHVEILETSIQVGDASDTYTQMTKTAIEVYDGPGSRIRLDAADIPAGVDSGIPIKASEEYYVVINGVLKMATFVASEPYDPA